MWSGLAGNLGGRRPDAWCLPATAMGWIARRSCQFISPNVDFVFRCKTTRDVDPLNMGRRPSQHGTSTLSTWVGPLNMGRRPFQHGTSAPNTGYLRGSVWVAACYNTFFLLAHRSKTHDHALWNIRVSVLRSR
jgi:hypothetical protein